MPPESGPSPRRERLLRAGIGIGVALVVIPFVIAVVSIARVSAGPEGLRGAARRPEARKEFGFAVGSTSVLAFLVLPGVLIGVSSGLALAEGRRKRDRAEDPSDEPR